MYAAFKLLLKQFYACHLTLEQLFPMEEIAEAQGMMGENKNFDKLIVRME